MVEKKKIKKNWISKMAGVCVILFALVIICSNRTPFEFLSRWLTAGFGFIGLWIALPYVILLGFYLIFNKRLIQFKTKMSLWGFLVIIIAFIILSSYWGSTNVVVDGVKLKGFGKTEDGAAHYLIFSNSIKVFNQIRNEMETTHNITFNPQLGGGAVGFILAGAFNSALTPVGLNIICWILFIGGMVMLLNPYVTKLFNYLKKRTHTKEKPERKPIEEDDVTFGDEADNSEVGPVLATATVSNQPTVSAPVFNQNNTQQPNTIEFHTSSLNGGNEGLKPAHFAFQDETVIKLTPSSAPQSTPVAPNPTFVEPAPAAPIANPVVEEPINEPEPTPVVVADPIEPTRVAPDPAPTPIIPTPTPVAPAPAPVVAAPEPVKIDPLHRPQPPYRPILDYVYPTLDILDIHEEAGDSLKNEASCEERTNLINEKLRNLRVGAQVVGHTVGPSVTRFDLQMNQEVSVSTVQRYISDIAMALNGASVRFEQIVPGKSTSGLEIPNEIRTNVGLRESIAGLPSGQKYLLNIPFGKNITGDLVQANLADFPHMLVSGTTGSGKSIFVHSTILTLLMRNKPDEIKLMLVDPKKVEMNYYESIPHLLCPTICDPKKTYVALQKLVDEMERRYNLFQENRVRDIKGFNEWAKSKDIQPLPYIIVFIDEYADLIDTCKEVRDPVVRIVQKARAAGIHMVIATQRPSVNVIDGVIKANVSTRVALMSASAVDSQTIIGEGGAEKLLGNGDMLIESPLLSRSSKPRVQGCFVKETEINRVCDFLREHYQPQYDPEFMNLEPKPEAPKEDNAPAIEAIDKSKGEDEQYQDIKEQVMHREYCSISFIQRSFAMGFSRAGKIFNKLVAEGIVAEKGDARGCKVLVFAQPEQQMGTIEQSTFIPDSADEDLN